LGVADRSATDLNDVNKRADIMEIRKTITRDTHELLVAGRVDGEGANQLELEILAAIRANAQSIYVNLSQATFLCSAGLRALLQYWRQMKNNKRVLLVTRPSAEVDAVLATTGFKEQIVERV
jgi:anti-anti-sigma factor